MHISWAITPAVLAIRICTNSEVFVKLHFLYCYFPHMANVDINTYLTGLFVYLMRDIKSALKSKICYKDIN